MNYEDNTPNAAKLMESMRSTGYDNYTAICDIIDNAFDADADIVKVTIGHNESVEGKFVISITDNGVGMNRDTLSEALKLGSLSDKDAESLGKYGMGLVTASISMARRVTVITKHNGEYLTGIQDLDEVAEQNRFVKTVRESSNLEKFDFDSKLGGALSGTVVNLTKIDNLQNKQPVSMQNILIKNCSRIYRYFLNTNKKIFINGKEVRPSDPLWLEHDETQVLVDVTEEINVNGKTSPVRLRIVLLPLVGEADPTMDQTIRTQGFYLMRNNREIESGSTLNGLFKKHNSLNRFRAEIFFSSDLDQKMGVRFTKDGSDGLSEDIYSWVERLSTPQLQATRSLSEKLGRAKKDTVKHDGSERAITSKASTLKRPKLESTPNVAKQLKDVTPEAFTNVKFKVDSNTRLAPLFQFEMLGDEVKINYNVDHPFYQRVFAEAKDNPNLTNAMDFIIYSMTVALVGITSTEETWHLQEDFLDRMSDNLRALLS